jgi:predicted dehydrogenase
MEKKNNNKLSRRKFIAKTGLAAGAITILPREVLGGKGFIAPSDKLNIAAVGVGGAGGGNMKGAGLTENIVAMCDVDWKYAKTNMDLFPKAKKYKDFRKMLDEMHKDIDGVIVGTPDHTHAIVASHAMKAGKHVFVQKPLTHSVYEARYLTELANKMGVATQMGNQANSGDEIRKVCEWIWDGAIGDVHEVHCWTNRPIWPQGLERPKETMEIPETLDWDLFLGPAPHRSYHVDYHPWNWRAWWDFGTGALGDMGCHIMDAPFKALKLKYPDAVEASSTDFNTESAPIAECVTYYFPAREDMSKVAMPPVKLVWYDGGWMPQRPPELKDGEMLGDWGGGIIFVGTKGKIVTGGKTRNPKLLGVENYQPPKILRRIPDEKARHTKDWLRACKESPENRVEPSSNFNYSGPFTETVVMGNLAVRLQDLKRKLLWDGENMKITNINEGEYINVLKSKNFTITDGHPKFDNKYTKINALEAAKQYIKKDYRKGWSL